MLAKEEYIKTIISAIINIGFGPSENLESVYFRSVGI